MFSNAIKIEFIYKICSSVLRAMGSWVHSNRVFLSLFSITSTRQNSTFSVVGLSTWNGLPAVLPWTSSLAFFPHLWTAIFSRAGVERTSEQFSSRGTRIQTEKFLWFLGFWGFLSFRAYLYAFLDFKTETDSFPRVWTQKSPSKFAHKRTIYKCLTWSMNYLFHRKT